MESGSVLGYKNMPCQQLAPLFLENELTLHRSMLYRREYSEVQTTLFLGIQYRMVLVASQRFLVFQGNKHITALSPALTKMLSFFVPTLSCTFSNVVQQSYDSSQQELRSLGQYQSCNTDMCLIVKLLLLPYHLPTQKSRKMTSNISSIVTRPLICSIARIANRRSSATSSGVAGKETNSARSNAFKQSCKAKR